jgi:hypothetical protein
MGDFHSSKNFAVAIGLANVLCMLRIPTKNLNNIIGLAGPKKKCLRLGLLWSLITFSTLAFISHCQCWPSRVLLLVFFPISIHFTAAPLFSILVVFTACPGLSFGICQQTWCIISGLFCINFFLNYINQPVNLLSLDLHYCNVVMQSSKQFVNIIIT